jgi:hypothetical protein
MYAVPFEKVGSLHASRKVQFDATQKDRKNRKGLVIGLFQ